MLLNLLPGLRDLRAPLAAGYLWLTAGWLYFAPRLPNSVNDAQGVLKDVYRIVNASSPVAVATALTFVAYILGYNFDWFVDSTCSGHCPASVSAASLSAKFPERARATGTANIRKIRKIPP
jgi:hypothetical protein